MDGGTTWDDGVILNPICTLPFYIMGSVRFFLSSSQQGLIKVSNSKNAFLLNVLFNPENPEKICHGFQQLNCFQHWSLQEIFLAQQISILEWFLKDHVTLKTGLFHNITVFFTNKSNLAEHKRLLSKNLTDL